MPSQKGFSLVELLIVVAVIGIIAAIAVPSLIQARRASEESSAIGCLRAYSSAQLAFYTTRGKNVSFATQAELANGFVDPAFVTAGVRNGYTFMFTLGANNVTFQATADPQDVNPTIRHFYTDSTGVIRFAYAPATATSTPLGS